MNEPDNDRYTRPSASPSPLGQAVTYAGVGAIIGAAVNTASQIAANWFRKTPQAFSKGRLLTTVGMTTALSAVVGYVQARKGEKDQAVTPSFSAEEAKEAIKNIVTDPAVIGPVLNAHQPSADDIQNIVHEAVRNSPAMKQLEERASKLTPEARQGLCSYMEKLRDEVSRIDTRKPGGASWEESVTASDDKSQLQR